MMTSKRYFVRGRAFFLLFAGLFLLSGTTYVIKEGDQEVGRYEEPDGRDEIREIQNEKPAPRAAPVQELSEEEAVEEKIARLKAKPRWKGVFSSLAKDPDFVAYAQTQPWMKKLREWDKRYHLRDLVAENYVQLHYALYGLIGFWILFRLYRTVRWIVLKVRKKRQHRTKEPEETSAP